MAEDGTIYGTPEEAGVFEVTIKAAATKASTMNMPGGDGESSGGGGASPSEGGGSGGMGGSTTSNFIETFTLTITE